MTHCQADKLGNGQRTAATFQGRIRTVARQPQNARSLLTDETDLPLPQGLTTLESFYKHFAAAVGGMTTSAVESLRELEARYRLESLNAELADIEKKISKEVQLDRKYALAKEKQRIERELGRVTL